MNQEIIKLISQSVEKLQQQGVVPGDARVDVRLERTRDKSHGDWASNIALMLAKPCSKNPRQLAQLIVDQLPQADVVEKVEIAGPGFINFYLNDTAKYAVINKVLQQKQDYGKINLGQGKRVLIEFVSANPTGPLHVGHGRGAAFGATLANLLTQAGYNVDKEYYVNDAGRQMDILAVSVWLRYLALYNCPVPFPVNGYQGDYVVAIATQLKSDSGDKFVVAADKLLNDLPADANEGGDKEEYIDALIVRAKTLLGEAGFDIVHAAGLNAVLDDIKQDLAEFGVEYERWYSERSLVDNNALQKGIDTLKQQQLTYEKEGALWFKATEFGDEKDRVLVRANGQSTYFASDVAYHWDKYDRSYDRVVDIFGADHHGYVTRVKAAVQALGYDTNAFEVLLVQFAILYRGSEKVQMSTRSGEFVTLRQLRQEVGSDAARFFYVMRKTEQHMDFDLELAKSKSNENPVYYIQYAHARICSVMRQLEQKQLSFDEQLGLDNLSILSLEHELQLMTLLARYPEVIASAARSCEVHQIAYYCRELATAFHGYYNSEQFIVDDTKLRNARLCLIMSVKWVLSNGLTLLGVSSPEQM